MRTDIGNEAVPYQHAAALIESRGRIDQPRIDERDG
jgi:hypothetical protein